MEMHIAADGIAGADAKLSPAQRMGFHDLVFPSLDKVDGRFNMTQKNLPLRGKLDALGTPDKEILVQLFFQYLDGLAYGRLGDEELFGGFGEA